MSHMLCDIFIYYAIYLYIMISVSTRFRFGIDEMSHMLCNIFIYYDKCIDEISVWNDEMSHMLCFVDN